MDEGVDEGVLDDQHGQRRLVPREPLGGGVLDGPGRGRRSVMWMWMTGWMSRGTGRSF